MWAAISTAAASEELKQAFAKIGADPVTGSPEVFGKLIGDEVDRWGKLAQAANIKVQ